MWSFVRRDALTVWNHVEMLDRLQVYKSIYEGKKIPRYILAKLFYVKFSENDTLDALISVHNHTMKKFTNWVKKHQGSSPSVIQKEIDSDDKKEDISNNNYLKLKTTIFHKILENCEFCENKCHVNRKKGELGRCKVDDNAYIASAFIHTGEESPIVPSGTIFFYGCTMKCVFCQNYDISQEYSLDAFQGKSSSANDLSRLYSNLKNQKARNINFVGGDPTPNLHIILESMLFSNVNLPMLWNSNMYLSEKSMTLIADLFDIWLPDMKYANNQCAEELSKIPNYWDVLMGNMKMIEELGSGEYIIRHLVMPNHIECCSLPILDWIDKNLQTPLINIMGQYRPEYKVQSSEDYIDIQRRPTSIEIEKVRKYAEKLGLFWKSVS